MRAGNSSTSVVTIPNFFYTRNLLDVQAFKELPEKRYFAEKKLYKHFRDINISGNPRNDAKKFEEYNKKRFKPMHKMASMIFTHKEETEHDISKANNSAVNSFKLMQDKNSSKSTNHLYSNDEQKREFATKILGLLSNINNGDPKVKLVEPILKNQTNTDLMKPLMSQSKMKPSIDFDQIKTKVIIDYYNGEHRDNSVKIFEKSLDNKFKGLKSLVERDDKVRIQKELDRIKEIEWMHPDKFPRRYNHSYDFGKRSQKILPKMSELSQTNLKHSTKEKYKKKTLEPIDTKEETPKAEEDYFKQDPFAGLLKKEDSSVKTNQPVQHEKQKEVVFDSSRYKSLGYNIYSERYNSDYCENEFKYKIYFE